MCCTPVEERARHQAVRDIERILHDAARGWQSVSVAVFGSFAEKCRPAHLFSSDVDCALIGVPGFEQTSDEVDGRQAERNGEQR